MSKIIYDSQLNAEPYETWGNETRGKRASFNENYGNEGRRGNPKTTPPSADVSGYDRVRSYEYPLSKQNDHFVRFTINLTEESRLIKKGRVGVIGDVDNSGQNRLNTNDISQQAVGAGVTAVATAAASPLLGAGALALAATFGAGRAIVATGAVAAGLYTSDTDVMGTIGEKVDELFAFTNRLKKLAAQVVLYTPSSVRVQYGLDFSIVDNNLLAILAQEKNFESLKQGLSNPALSDVGKILQLMASTSELGSLLSKRAVNKRKDLQFRGVNNRTFNFDYVFAPRNKAEAEEVAGIIFMFKYFAHPELSDGYMNFMYTYPAEFDIEYGIRSKGDNDIGEYMNRNLNRISSCALVGISVDYSPNGSFQTLEQGEPCIVALGLQFQEIETLHRDKIGQGY